MPDHLHISAIPLASLLAKLKSEGFDISTATLLDIQKVIANLDREELTDFRELQSVLSPFICRNKEEQEHFNKVFEKFAASITPQATTTFLTPQLPNRKRIFTIGLLILIFLLILTAIYYWTKQAKTAPSITLQVETNTGPGEGYALPNDPVIFRTGLQDTSEGKNYTVTIKIDDSLYKNVREVQKVFPQPGIHKAMSWLLNKRGDTIAQSISPTVEVKCERTPSVAIRKLTTAQNLNSGMNVYTAEFTNPSKDSALYKYNWYINDSLISAQRKFSTSYRSDNAYELTLYVQTNGTHCSTDSLVTFFKELPPYELSLIPTTPLQLEQAKNWRAIMWALVYGFLLPTTAAAFIRYYRKRKTKIPPDQQMSSPAQQEEYSGPFKIEFKKQDDKISTEKEISQMAEAMRKRHVGDVMHLDVRKTITNTIRSGGFPSLIFTPRTQPTDFLVLLDRGHAGGHQVQLFEYVLKKFQNEQVNIISYYFYKEPLFLSNEKLNHSMLPVEKVSRLYPNTVLFIFSNTDAFFQSLNRKLKPWVNEKFKLWQHKIIVTPVAVDDWDYKETALLNEGFTVVPADLNAHQLIISEINDLINREKLKRMPISSAYSSRFINFDDWNELQKYLGDDPELLQWVCALAVYPYIDWKVTVAIGKAIEENSATKNQLVTYSNLLKISRIKWMQSGVQPDELRLKMLQHLETRTEVIARKTMVQLLTDVEAEINDSSLVKNEFQLNKTVNRFLLHTQDPEKNSLADVDKEMMKEFVEKQWLDYPLENYLNRADNTLLRNNNKASVTPGEYFRNADAAYQKKISRELKFRRIAAAAALLIGIFLLFQFFINKNNYTRQQQYADISFNLSSTDTVNIPGIRVAIVSEDSSYRGEMLTDTSIVIKGVLIDSTKPATVKVETTYGNLSLERPIDFKWKLYNLFVGPTARKEPLYIRYNDAALFSGVEAQLNQQLYSYNISASQQDFTDSSRIVYYETSQKPKADSIVDIIKKTLGLNVRTQFIEEVRIPVATPILFLNLSSTGSCNNVSINTLPANLNEIWQGKKSNRLATIDLTKRLIYYSTGDKSTYGTYRIEEACMMAPGVFKILTTAGRQYQVFLFSYVQRDPSVLSRTFTLAICPNRYDTKEEAMKFSETNCNQPDDMSLFFENDQAKIFFNYQANSFSNQEDLKLKKMLTTGQRRLIEVIVSNNILLHPRMNTESVLNDVRKRGKLTQEQSKAGPLSSFRGTPFDRSYILLTITDPVTPDVTQNNNGRVTQTIQPDCDKTFYTLSEAIAVNPRVVCKLNLEKESPVTLPKELYQFVNMQELNLGASGISDAAIKDLQSALPNCKIIYRPRQVSIPADTSFRQLSIIYFDNPGVVSRTNINLLKQMENVLLNNSNAKIRLVAYYGNASEQKDATANVAAIRRYLLSNQQGANMQVQEQLIRRSATSRKEQNPNSDLSNNETEFINKKTGTGPNMNTTGERTSVTIFGSGFPANFNIRQSNALPSRS